MLSKFQRMELKSLKTKRCVYKSFAAEETEIMDLEAERARTREAQAVNCIFPAWVATHVQGDSFQKFRSIPLLAALRYTVLCPFAVSSGCAKKPFPKLVSECGRILKDSSD